MTDTIEFVSAPPPQARRGAGTRTSEFVEALKGRPGEWAIYPTAPGTKGVSGITSYLKNRYGCEVVTRKVDGDVKVYARWVGVS